MQKELKRMSNATVINSALLNLTSSADLGKVRFDDNAMSNCLGSQ